MEHNKSVLAEDSLLPEEHPSRYEMTTTSIIPSGAEDDERDAQICDSQESKLNHTAKKYISLASLGI